MVFETVFVSVNFLFFVLHVTVKGEEKGKEGRKTSPFVILSQQ